MKAAFKYIDEDEDVIGKFIVLHQQIMKVRGTIMKWLLNVRNSNYERKRISNFNFQHEGKIKKREDIR